MGPCNGAECCFRLPPAAKRRSVESAASHAREHSQPEWRLRGKQQPASEAPCFRISSKAAVPSSCTPASALASLRQRRAGTATDRQLARAHVVPMHRQVTGPASGASGSCLTGESGSCRRARLHGGAALPRRSHALARSVASHAPLRRRLVSPAIGKFSGGAELLWAGSVIGQLLAAGCLPGAPLAGDEEDERRNRDCCS
jgi:hypothetical protein